MMLAKKDPSEDVVTGLYGIMRLFNWSWSELMDTPLPSLFELYKQMERENREMERERKKCHKT